MNRNTVGKKYYSVKKCTLMEWHIFERSKSLSRLSPRELRSLATRNNLAEINMLGGSVCRDKDEV
jgi:hypothetical protein